MILILGVLLLTYILNLAFGFMESGVGPAVGDLGRVKHNMELGVGFSSLRGLALRYMDQRELLVSGFEFWRRI